MERRPKILLQCVALYVHVTQNKEVGIQKDDSSKTPLASQGASDDDDNDGDGDDDDKVAKHPS